MADLKISQLTGASTPLAGTEVLPIVQSSTTKKVAVSDLTAGRAVSVGSLASTGGLRVSGYLATGAFGYYINAGNSGTINYIQSFNNTTLNDLSLDCNTFAIRVAGFATAVAVDTASNLSIGGNFVPGTAAKGINFTANTPAAGMTSQLLNWYEEGTWTPQYTNTTPPTTPYTMTIYSATYTRIGRQVTVRAFIATSNVNITGASGELSISGLPFAPASSNAAYSAANVASLANWTTYPAFGYVAGDSKIYLEKRAASNGASANMTAADLVAGATAGQNLMMITATYFTA